MSPMQLFIVGHENDELASDSEGDISQAHDTILPSATEAVEVSNLRFRPCANLKSEIEAIAQLPSPTNGYDLYRRAALFMGEHLRNQCIDCVFG